MGNIMEIINGILPWVLLIFLAYFTLVLASYGVGVFRARKADNSLRLALNSKGKFFFGALTLIYLLLLFNTIRMEILIWTSAEITDKLTLALQAPNILTVFTLIFAIETQDIFFVGKKNVLIGNSMFEFRRMKRLQYPKKNKISFIYGQKEYTYSIRFVDLTDLKTKFSKVR